MIYVNPKATNSDLADLCINLLEVTNQAESDLCGDQRTFHLPRLRKAFAGATMLFPQAMIEAMAEAKDAWGDLIEPPDASDEPPVDGKVTP